MKRSSRTAARAAHFLWAALALLSASSAWAGGPSFFEPVAGDKSISEFLAPAFGSLFGGTGGAGFESAIGVLNAAALVVGGLIASYTLVFGTMQTAHDGEMLGRKWSSMWVPIRTSIGVGLVVPLGQGYCVAQFLVAWLATQGIGIADEIWSAYVGSFADAVAMAPKTQLPNVDSLALGVLKSQICMQGFNATRLKGADTTLVLSAPMAASSIDNGRAYGGGGFSVDACGSASYGLASKFLASYSSKNGVSGAAVAMFGASFDTDLAAKKLMEAHVNALTALEGSMASIASGIISAVDSGGAGPASADFKAAVVAYQTSVAAASQSLFGGADAVAEIRASAATDGWIMAGGWFMKAAQMQDMVSRAASAVPSTSPPTYAGFEEGLAASLGGYTGFADSWARTQASGFGLSGEAVARAGNTNNPIQDMAASITAKIAEGMLALVAPNGNRHPLMSVKDFGDYVMTAAEAGMLVALGAIAGSGAVEGFQNSVVGSLVGAVSLGAAPALLGAGAKMAATVGYLMMGLCVALLGLGAGIAIYLPFAPFIVFFGTALGWLVLVAEAVIAAPLWAVMHLHPSGDEMAGRASPGYMLLLGLLMRPGLIILGFCAAMILTPLFVGFMNKVFFVVFRASMAGSIMGLGTMIAMIAIYFGFMTYLFHKGFGLIHVVPDKLLRWIGGGGEQLGEHGAGASNAGRAAVAAVVANNVRGVSDGAARGADLAGQKVRGNEAAADRGAKAFQSMEQKTATSQARSAKAAHGARAQGASMSEKASAVTAHKDAAMVAGAAATEAEDMREMFSKMPGRGDDAAEWAGKASSMRAVEASENAKAKDAFGEMRSEALEASREAKMLPANFDAEDHVSAHQGAQRSLLHARDSAALLGDSQAAAELESRAAEHGRLAAGFAVSGERSPANNNDYQPERSEGRRPPEAV